MTNILKNVIFRNDKYEITIRFVDKENNDEADSVFVIESDNEENALKQAWIEAEERKKTWLENQKINRSRA